MTALLNVFYYNKTSSKFDLLIGHHASMRFMMIKCLFLVKWIPICQNPALLISTNRIRILYILQIWWYHAVKTWFPFRVLCCFPYKNPILLHTDKKLNGILWLTLHCKCIYHRSVASCRNSAVQSTFQNVKHADPYTLFISALIFLPVFFPHCGTPYIFDQIMIFWNWQRHWGLKIVS